jgi:signal transduction histidine kinase
MGNVNIEILLGIIAFSFNSFLAAAVIFTNSKNSTNRLFFCLAILANAYVIVNFFSLHPPIATPENQLLWIRVVMFTCSFIGPALVLLVHTFPNHSISLKPKFLVPLVILMIASASASLLPLVFSGISYPGGKPVPTPGPGIPIFFLDFVGLFILSFAILIVRYKRAFGEEKARLKLLLLGVIASFSLMGICTVVFVAILKISSFVFLGPIFPVILMSFIAYAIVKHGLFDLKIIATEILTVLLTIILLAKTFVSPTLAERGVDIFIFLGSLIFGSLLVRSVRREVKQRMELQNLTIQLEDANEKLKALDQARSEFITIASHQLRTPPATIKWYLSALTSGDYGKFKKDQLEILNKATRTNNSQISLIDDMLNVSRIERGKMEFLFEPADLVTLAKITFEQLEPSAIDKHLKFTLKVPKKKLPSLMADKEKLRQVMNNLIDNAIKYTKEGTVEAKLETTPTEIIFSVTDSGKGISDTEKSGIFEKFSRGKQSVMQSSGLGLGLYVAKVVIEQHKGQIWAESEGPGKGSKFIFSLPINSGLSKTTLVDLAQGK